MRPSSRLMTLWVIVILLVLFIALVAKQADAGWSWLEPAASLLVVAAVLVTLLDWLLSKRSLGLHITRNMPDHFSVGKAHDIEYWGGACTRNVALQGRCNGGIDGRLVHPLEPRSLRASLRIGF